MDSVTEPSAVYLMALFRRLMSICLILTSSPTSRAGSMGSTSTWNASPFSFARTQSIPTSSESIVPVS